MNVDPDIFRATFSPKLTKVRGLCVTCKVFPYVAGKRRCSWCLLAAEPVDVQSAESLKRRASADPSAPRTRPKADWPVGMRWCSGCRSYVALTYTSGAQCKGCALTGRRERTWGLSPDQQAKLLIIQDNRCPICGRNQRRAALAVDHRHSDEQVRGFLCDVDNQAIGANWDDIQRFVNFATYLIDPPARRVGIGPAPWTTAEVITEIRRMVIEYRKSLGYDE